MTAPPVSATSTHPLSCSQCGKVAQTRSDRVPRGWKRADRLYCDACWIQRMVLRTIVIPVARIVDGDWKEFDASLRSMWSLTTQCSNWMLTQLYARDIRREDQLKMPRMARVYLYPEARTLFPHLPPQSVAALQQMAQLRYRKLRYDLIWRHAVALPTYRYPTPFTLPNPAWSVVIEEGQPVVQARIGERKWRLGLRAGSRYRRQIAGLNTLINEGLQGSLDFYQRRIDGKLMTLCKMVAWLPRTERKETTEGTLLVRTASKSLLVATNAKDDKLWEYHGDHIRRWSGEHRRQLERWLDDTKFEQRPEPSFHQRRQQAAEKYGRRMASAVQEISAQLAGYALRRRFASVRYDDQDKTFCPGFPWFRLRDRLRVKLNEYGMSFEAVANAPEIDGPREPLAER